jgi:hypothetical protein
MMDPDLDLAMKFEEQYIQIAIAKTICSSRLPAHWILVSLIPVCTGKAIVKSGGEGVVP